MMSPNPPTDISPSTASLADVTHVENISTRTTADDGLLTPPPDYKYFIPYHALLLVICLPTAVFDMILLLTIVKNRVLWSVQTAYLCSLACSDLGHTCGGVIYGILRLLSVGPRSNMWTEATTRVFSFFFWFSTATTYFSFLAISLNRWLYITRPFLHQRLMTSRFVAGSIAGIWVMSAVLNVMEIVKERDYIHSVFLFPIAHTTFCIIIVVIYTHIIIISLRQTRAVANAFHEPQTVAAHDNSQPPPPPPHPKHTFKMRNNRAVKMLVSIFCVFACTLSPYVYVNAIQQGLYPNNEYLETVCSWLLILSLNHYCFNLVAYVRHHRVFRDKLRYHARRLICCTKTQVSNDFTLLMTGSKPGHKAHTVTVISASLGRLVCDIYQSDAYIHHLIFPTTYSTGLSTVHAAKIEHVAQPSVSSGEAVRQSPLSAENCRVHQGFKYTNMSQTGRMTKKKCGYF